MLEYLKVVSDSLLAPINLNSFAGIVLIVVLFKYLANAILRRCLPLREHPPADQSLEMRYFYHLAIIVLILPEISWNMFDLTVWVFSYIIVGMIRHLLNDIHTQRSLYLNGLIYDPQLSPLLSASQKLSFFALVFAVSYIFLANWYFWHASTKVNQVLLYPSFMLALDSVYILFSSQIIRKKMAYFFNNNIDSMSPIFALESHYTAIKSVLGLWHFSYFIRILYKTSSSLSQVLFSPWILQILKTFYKTCRSLGTCVIQYQNIQSLLKKIDTFLIKSSPQSDQNCAICQQQLLNCRQIKQCGHKFHFKCILMWMKSKQNSECPICRRVIIRSRFVWRARNTQGEEEEPLRAE